MKNTNTKKIIDIYKETLKELKEIKIRQDKIIKKYTRILEKEKIEKLRKALQE